MVVQLLGNPGWAVAAERYLTLQAERRQRGEPVDIRRCVAEVCDTPLDAAPYAAAQEALH